MHINKHIIFAFPPLGANSDTANHCARGRLLQSSRANECALQRVEYKSEIVILCSHLSSHNAEEKPPLFLTWKDSRALSSYLVAVAAGRLSFRFPRRVVASCASDCEACRILLRAKQCDFSSAAVAVSKQARNRSKSMIITRLFVHSSEKLIFPSLVVFVLSGLACC